MNSGTTPWWNTLPTDICDRFEGTELDAAHRLQVGSTAAFDHVLSSGLSAIVTGAFANSLWRSGGVLRERERLARYQAFAHPDDSSVVFPRPEKMPRVHRTSPRRFSRRSDVPSELLSFDSEYEPLCPELQDAYSRHRRNRLAHVQYWRHPGGPRPTLIFLHGYFASPYRINSWGFSLPWFYKKGYDIALYTLPFHGARHSRRQIVNGLGFFGHGMAHMNESMRHAVQDVRVLINFLEAEGAPAVGVSGLSLGGYLAALLAAVEPRLAFAIPNSPAVSLIDMMMGWQPSGALLKMVCGRYGIPVEELRHGTAFHCPLTYRPAIDADRLMVIGGAGDRFTPPRLVRLLHEHWAGSHLHWFPGNHIMHLQQAGYLRLMKTFMDRHVGY